MKHLLLLCLMCAGSVAMAQNENMLQNPGFEDTNYEVFKYESVENCPDYVAGWNVMHERDDADFKVGDYNNEGLSKYQIRAQMGYYDETSEQAQSGNKQYIRISIYEWLKAAEWHGDGGMMQTVDVTPSHSYTLSFLYRCSDNVIDSDVVRPWVAFQEEGTEIEHKKIQNMMDRELWVEKNFDFTTSETATRATVWLGLTGMSFYEWGGQIDMWTDFDDVVLIDNGPIEESGIEDVVAGDEISVFAQGGEVVVDGIEAGEKVTIYNLVGGVVAAGYAEGSQAVLQMPKPGVYIVKPGNKGKARKVVVR